MRKSAVKAQGLIFGALMAALVIIFAFTQVLAFLIPIPLVLTYLRFGGRVAVLTGIVATIFSLLFASPDVALLQVLPMGVLPGLALGCGFHHKWKPLYTGALAVLSFCGGFGLIYMIVRFGLFAGNDPIMQIATMLKEIIGNLIAGLQTALAQSTDPKRQEALTKSLQQLVTMQSTVEPMVRNLIPAAVLLGGVGFSWLNMKLCAIILPRLGQTVQSPTPFGNLYLPRWAIWGSFIPLLGLQVMLLPAGTQPWWIEVARNIVLAAVTIYGAIGAAVVYGWLIRNGTPRGVAILIGLFGYFVLSPFLIMLAVWDAIFDFRRLGHGTLSRDRAES